MPVVVEAGPQRTVLPFEGSTSADQLFDDPYPQVVVLTVEVEVHAGSDQV